MNRAQALQLARFALCQHYGARTAEEEPSEWVIDAIRMAGASGKVEGAELVLQLLQTKGMLATLLGLVRELTDTLEAAIEGSGDGTAMMVALLRQAKQAIESADKARLSEFLRATPEAVQTLTQQSMEMLDKVCSRLGVNDDGLPLEDGENTTLDEARAFLKVHGIVSPKVEG